MEQGFLQQLRQIAGRMSSGSPGAGIGVKLLIGAGALVYGLKEAMYTGTWGMVCSKSLCMQVYGGQYTQWPIKI